MVQVKRNNNRRPFLRKQDENKRKEGKKKLITHRESTVTSKSLAPIRLLSSPSLPVRPQLIKVLQKTGPWLQLNRDTEHGVPQVRLERKRERECHANLTCPREEEERKRQLARGNRFSTRFNRYRNEEENFPSNT